MNNIDKIVRILEENSNDIKTSGHHDISVLESSEFRNTSETIVENLTIPVVSGTFVITESAQEKLDFILGHSTTRDFPKVHPTKEWAGAVLDFLEITKLLK